MLLVISLSIVLFEKSVAIDRSIAAAVKCATESVHHLGRGCHGTLFRHTLIGYEYGTDYQV